MSFPEHWLGIEPEAQRLIRKAFELAGWILQDRSAVVRGGLPEHAAGAFQVGQIYGVAAQRCDESGAQPQLVEPGARAIREVPIRGWMSVAPGARAMQHEQPKLGKLTCQILCGRQPMRHHLETTPQTANSPRLDGGRALSTGRWSPLSYMGIWALPAGG